MFALVLQYLRTGEMPRPRTQEGELLCLSVSLSLPPVCLCVYVLVAFLPVTLWSGPTAQDSPCSSLAQTERRFLVLELRYFGIPFAQRQVEDMPFKLIGERGSVR